MTVGELLERVSSRELTEWEAYYGIEPFGQERGDLQAGVVASVMANAWSDPKKRKREYGPGDFVLRFDGEDERESQVNARKIYERFRAWAESFKH